jgi:hypothetical protein
MDAGEDEVRFIAHIGYVDIERVSWAGARIEGDQR